MVRHYTEQFKKDAIAYVRDHADLSVNTWAKNLGVSNSTLHN
jgi:DNA-binding transcriptional regulator YiaG